VADTSTTTWAYPDQQNRISFTNKGDKAITLVVGATNTVVQPRQTVELIADFTTFTTQSAGQTQEFYARTTVVVIIAGQVQLPFRSVKEFGAKGDGSTDDCAAINATIAAVAATGGSVYFPPGTFMIGAGNPYSGSSSDGSIRGKSNVNLELSAGATVKVIGNALSNSTIFNFTNCSNITVRGGTLLGDRYRRSGGDMTENSQQGMGFWLEGANDIRIIDVTCKEFWGDGIYTKYNATYGANKNLLVRGFKAYDCRRQGISLCAVDGVNIINIVIENTNGINGTGPGTGASAGIDLEPELNGSVFNVNIDNCTFRNNRVGVNAGSATGVGLSHVSITNCTFVGHTTYGLRVGQQSQYFTIGHNTFKANTLPGIYVNTATDINISDNISTGNSSHGIHLLNGGDRTTLSTNRCSGNTGMGIYIENCDAVTLTANATNNNTASGIQVESSDYIQVNGGRSHNNSARGIYLYDCNFSKIDGAVSYRNGTNGIQLTDVEDSQLTNCNAYQNSQAASLASDNIFISGNSINNMVQNCQARKGALANLPRYGFRIDAATVTGTVWRQNDFRGGGQTADTSDIGTGSVTT
jgi:parallel beta-helix repeat protein